MALDRVPVCFRPEMVAEAESFSPSAGKPAAVVADWRRAGLPVELRSFEPLDAATLALAHDAEWVRQVLAGEANNGFGNRSASVARSLPYTSGAMLAAAREALANRLVAVAPVSGFHHARYRAAAGYCTFNGLVVAARQLEREGRVRRVGIVDLDQHYGDGTAEILRDLGLDFVTHYTAGEVDWRPDQAAVFLRQLPAELRAMQGCELVLYQAGADPHVDDPLGGFLSTAQLAQRDRIVFEWAREAGIPVAWNLAGGYQRDAEGSIEPVLEIHRNTMRACVQTYCTKGPEPGGAAGNPRPAEGAP